MECLKLSKEYFETLKEDIEIDKASDTVYPGMCGYLKGTIELILMELSSLYPEAYKKIEEHMQFQINSMKERINNGK